MGLSEADKRRIEEEERFRAQASTSVSAAKQTHGVPALLSFFIPGLGQLVKGQVGKGILIFFGFIFGLVLLVIPGVVIWVWQIIDAYND